MGNNVTSTRGIRLKYKDSYVQAVILPDGRKLVLTGNTYSIGTPLSPLSEIAVAKKSDLKWVVNDLLNCGYQKVDRARFYDELRAFNSTMPWS